MTHSAPRRYCLYPSNLLWHWCDLDRLRSCDKRDLGPEIQAPNSQDLWFQQVELPPCPILDSSDDPGCDSAGRKRPTQVGGVAGWPREGQRRNHSEILGRGLPAGTPFYFASKLGGVALPSEVDRR